MRSPLRTVRSPVERYVRDLSDAALHDDPPGWAPAAAALLGAVLVVVLVANFLLDPHPGPTGGSMPRSVPAPATAPVAPGGDPSTPGTTFPAPAAEGHVALADRNGVFQQVPVAAVEAARASGAADLGVDADHVRHQLIIATADRYELTISRLDGQDSLRVAVTRTNGEWQAA
jgi:hypothetical protein